MKPKLALLSIILGCLLAALAATPPSGRVILAWDYPTNELGTNLTFRLYGSSNITTPLTNWTVLTNVVGTNLSVTVQIQPGVYFFALTASNFWMESDFSNVASTPALPRSDSKLGITRGP